MKRAIIIICIAGMLPLEGCGWPVHSREVEQLQLIQTLGCDVRGDGVTVSASSGPQPGGGEGVRLAAGGESIPAAIRNLQHWSAREELFFSHVRYAVLGEDAARRGAGPLLDYFERSTQTPMNLPLLVVRGGTARELVTASEDPDYEATVLLASLQRDTERMGTAHCFSVLDVARRLSRSGAALCCAVAAREPGGNVPSAGEGALPVVEAGYAVLREGRLAGFLNADESLGTDLLLGLAGAARYVLPRDEGTVTVELRSAEAALTPRWDPDTGIVLDAELQVRAGVIHSDGADPGADGVLPELEQALARAVQLQAEAALEASRTLEADFLELAALTERKAGGLPRGARAAGGFPPLTWQVRVQASVERSYDVYGAVPIAGEEAAP